MLPALLLLLLPALTGPPDCRFSVPVDMHAGPAEWLGPCAHDLAEGVGVLRVAQPSGRAELFYGQLHQGHAVKGIFGDSEGNFTDPTHQFNPRTGQRMDDNASENPAGQDARLWDLGAAAARAAMHHYEALGNKPSADFYRARMQALGKGPPE